MSKLILSLIFVAICILCLLGWTRNVIKFTNCDFKAPYKAEIVRGVGIPVIPLGIVLGCVQIKDGKTDK